jgi:hypothetical protein
MRASTRGQVAPVLLDVEGGRQVVAVRLDGYERKGTGWLLYGYAGADWTASGSAPVGVGPGYPTWASGGKRVEFTAARGQG